ncbi:MAG: lipoyl(octanoyl) transferase LipB [Alphaproteobacteria bacterium]
MNAPVEHLLSKDRVDYPTALAAMEERVSGILDGSKPEALWFLEHPPLYTSGTSARQSDLLGNMPFPVFDAGRGGQWTYHGPGQRVVYVMLDLKKRDTMDLRQYVKQLEQWIIATLAYFGVEGFTREERIGVWVNEALGIWDLGLEKEKRYSPMPNALSLTPNLREAKIAALGIRVRKWVTFHGICLNVQPDLSHYNGIVPCGINNYGVTSLKALGISASMDEVDEVLKEEFGKIFT